MDIKNKSNEEILELINEKEPTLSGFGVNRDDVETDKIIMKEVFCCLEWLEDKERTKKANYRVCSYDCKHVVEKWHEEKYGQHKYISNGAFIAAVILADIPYKKYKGPNVNVGLAKKCLLTV
jgi:hypothetical protein